MTIKEHRDLIYETYYRPIGFPNENSYHSIKQKKMFSYCLQLSRCWQKL